MKNISNHNDIIKLCTALSLKTRLDIIDEIIKNPNITLNELATNLNLTNGALTSHIKMLSDLNIVSVTSIPANRGVKKVCNINNLMFNIDLSKKNLSNTYTEEIPLGLFCDFKTSNNCGMIFKNNNIVNQNDKTVFYQSKRINAKTIWLENGYLKYHLPNYLKNDECLKSISLSFRLSNKILKDDEKTNVLVKINEFDICTILCDNVINNFNFPYISDDNFTEYNIMINDNGTFLNDKKTDDFNINDFKINKDDELSLKFIFDKKLAFFSYTNSNLDYGIKFTVKLKTTN